MPNVLLPLQPSSLPPGICYASEQDRLNSYADNLHAILNGQSFYNFGDTVPAVELQSYPWFRTVDYRWYTYDGGWISANPEQSEYVRRLFVGTLAQLILYDGGDNTPLSDRSGPMWEEDVAFQGRSPIGPGALPTSGTAVVVATNYGADQATLLANQLPASINLTVGTNDYGEPPMNPTSFRLLSDDQDVDGQRDQTSTFTNPGGGQPVNTLTPVRGAYVIRRTARVYYKV